MNPIAALLIFLAGFGAAWSWQGSRGEAQVADLKHEHSQQALDAATIALRKLKVANDRADAIDKAAAARAAAQTAKLQETQHALKTATRNRPCLGNAALGVLGQSPGLRLGPAVAETPGPLHDGPAAAAADPAHQGDEEGDEEGDYATDTQIADWIATAGDLYERCRSRIRDIRAWSEGER